MKSLDDINRFTRVAMVVCLGLASGRALAQSQVAYELVDPGVADASALGESFRLVPLDLRTPTGFDRVYRLPTLTGEEMFARIDGGLTAVFPRSEYDRGGATIPAGTTWYIGALPADRFGVPADLGQTSSFAVSNRVDLRVRSRTGDRDGGIETGIRVVRNPAMPWAGELERAGRVAILLRRAARVRE